MMATASCLRFTLWFCCTTRPWRDWPAQALGSTAYGISTVSPKDAVSEGTPTSAVHDQPVESVQLLEHTRFAACKQQLCTARGGKDQTWSEPAEQGYKPELTAPWPLTEKAASPRGGEKATKERESEQDGEQKAEGPM